MLGHSHNRSKSLNPAGAVAGLAALRGGHRGQDERRQGTGIERWRGLAGGFARVSSLLFGAGEGRMVLSFF